ncbi:MAG: ABC transporter substrate-binding protein [Verrucomicrobiota bacterium]|nr:ABC transporter substrate-binding protein [Verrucomicrobiota bacterium]
MKTVLRCVFGLVMVISLMGYLTGCGKKVVVNTETKLFPITVQLDWFAEPEHGAFYTAKALKYFEQEGLDVTLLDGGPGAFVTQKVATGVAQFGQYDSTNSFLAIQEGLPITNIAVVFQHDPTALLMQESNPVKTFADLNGKVIKARPEWAFLPFIKKKYGIDFRLVPQDFGLQELMADSTLVQQGFYIAEPFYTEQKGIKLKWLHVYDAGFDSCNTIIANREFLAKQPERVRAFLRAYYRGYKEYCEGDPTPAHDLMLAINKNATRAFLEWSRAQIIKENLAKGDPTKGGAGDYVMISPDRVGRQIAQMESLGLLKPGAVTVEKAVDARFLPVNPQ